MDSIAPSTSNFSSVARTITKILRFRRKASILGLELKQPKIIEDCSQVLEDEKVKKEPSCSDQEVFESLLASLFTSVSAIKASYAQLQVAQSPYDPDTLQTADQAVVDELKRLSELKHGFFKNRIGPPPPPPLAAQIEEHRNLIKTYKITTKKLESEIESKGLEIALLQAQLNESDQLNRSLGSSLAEINPSHFIAAVRCAVKSVRSFVKLMISEMESAGWDLSATAHSIQPCVHNKPGHWIFALESFVSNKLFSEFDRQDFGLSCLQDTASWGQREFFDEFTDSKYSKSSQGFRRFCRAKYLSSVHPKMETSFFGGLEQRGVVCSGRGFPESEFFARFAEAARRVWILHCLFFSFGSEVERSIFQVKRGLRFSEVFMESVSEDGEVAGPTVGFTVVPGFKIGVTVVQSKVYLSGCVENGRS